MKAADHIFFKPFFLYSLLASFIIGWWAFALHPSFSPPVFNIETPQTLTLKTSTLLQQLSPLDRESLKKALGGDLPLILNFIEQWDHEALALSESQIAGVERLSPESRLQVHLLKKLLLDSSEQSLHDINCKINLKSIRDDDGCLLEIKESVFSFLPQTYLSTSFLLAIAPLRQIMALPKGVRQFDELYPFEIVSKIPKNIHEIQSEHLYLNKPDLAFIAPYSHPSTLDLLRHQQIDLFSIKHIQSVHEIQEALLKVGHATHHILEAQLLAIFMDACFLSIDNRFRALNERYASSVYPLNFLYLSHRHHYALPTVKGLTGQLAARALSHCPHLRGSIPLSETQWQIPVGQEEIVQSAPDILMVSTYGDPQSILTSSLHQTAAYGSKRIFYLNEVVQDSPTQYIALAYFDIFQILAATYYV
ncbi:MAG: hypothetical protein ACH350_07515 [Parachlamydiaceae bacterium]